jgi:hypothetical protein
LKAVGQGYRFTPSAHFARVISFDYLQRDVPPGYEQTLTIYYQADGDTAWQRQSTQLDEANNRATAVMPGLPEDAGDGKGIYALIATLQVPAFRVGWNNFGYLVLETQPLPEALASIAEDYTILYQYRAADGAWLVYDPVLAKTDPVFAALVNTLHELQSGSGYWIHMTRAATLYLKVPGAPPTGDPAAGPPAVLALEAPPAAIYGPLLPSAGFSPTAGSSVQARVGDVLCGEGKVVAWNGGLVYSIQVAAEDGCGVPGAQVRLSAAEQPAGAVTWDNTRATFLALTGQPSRLFVPLIPSR